ncbi:MAG TPA: hypothetical protein VMY06_01160 [Sedimentisphaerales bacterium]|nr:hypothetical protein [Sedimentisphaerales bacterium]
MNVTNEMKKDYEQMDTWTIRKNEPKTNPIRTQTNPIKANLQNARMNVNKVLTKNYGIILNWAIYPKQTQTKPIQNQTNPTCSELVESISPPHPATIFIFSVAKISNPALYSENTNP